MLFGLSPTPPPLSRQQVVSLSQSSCVSPVEHTSGRGGEGRAGAKSYEGENAWSSINQLILSGATLLRTGLDFFNNLWGLGTE